MSSLKNLTVIVVTYKTDEEILDKCLQSINKNVQIKLIENSVSFKDKELLEKKFPNLSVHCTGGNLGYGGGNNFGLKTSNTDFALILNPDVVCESNFFENIKLYLDKKLNFSIIGASLKEKSTFSSSGLFNENKNKIYFNNSNLKSLKKVDWVVGCAMLVNMTIFKDKNIFDEDYFLYFEEFDLCKNLEKKKKEVYSSDILLIDHLGSKGSFNSNPLYRIEFEKLRNWHWMWSTFYFYKKNYGFFIAYKKTISKLIKSLFKYIFYAIINNKSLTIKYKYRFLGLANNMMGRKSWFRINSF
jgi:N-acetylglucosaminyl-diphospho-decaprenol L-rhamnosyltransferase